MGIFPQNCDLSQFPISKKLRFNMEQSSYIPFEITAEVSFSSLTLLESGGVVVFCCTSPLLYPQVDNTNINIALGYLLLYFISLECPNN